MDLFPDVKESMDHLLDEIENQYHVPVDYPLAEFIILVGFFLILIVENIVAECQVRMNFTRMFLQSCHHILTLLGIIKTLF